MLDKRYEHLTALVVGCGSVGFRHARVLTELGLNRLVLCDTDEARLEAMKAAFPKAHMSTTFEDGLLMQPDVVFVLTPPATHVPLAARAIDAGCHVFVEKPLSDGMGGVDDLVRKRDRAGCKVMVGLCFRYHAGVQEARKTLRDGTIGRLVAIRALFGEYLPEVRPDYKRLHGAGGLGAYDLMHDLDLALWFADQPVRAVYAVQGAFSEIGIEAPDIAEILVEFQDRCVAAVHLDLFQQPRRRQLELMGVTGTIVLDFASWDYYELRVHRVGSDVYQLRGVTQRDDMFREEDRRFLDAVVDDLPIDLTIEEASRSLRVVTEARIRTGLFQEK